MMMTTDLLTFFQPGKTTGTTWAFSCPSAPMPREAWVYLPGEVDPSWFMAREIDSEEQLDRLLKEISAAIQDRGGLLVEARVHNEFIKVSVEGKEEAGYAAPRKMLRLRISGDPRIEAIPRSLDLTAGDHLILPVSAEAQQRLETFDLVFEGFPEDMRSTILNVLRRPSLEWRVNRIEQILSRPPATPAEWEKNRRKDQTTLQKLSHWFMWRIPAGPVAAMLLLLAGACAGYERWFGAVTATEATGAAQAESQGGTAPTEIDPGTESKGTNPGVEASLVQPATFLTDAEVDLNRSIDDLYGALEKTQIPALQQLYTTHFQDHQADFFSRSSPGPWGIAKLQALKWKILPSTDGTLGNLNLEARVKEVYQTQEGKAFLASDASAVELLAWGFCQRHQSAAMPRTNSAPQEPLPLPVGKKCEDLKPQDAIAGLEDLTKWVEEQNP